MSSFASEWAQLKREATADAGMHLAGVGGNSGGSGWVSSDRKAWSAAGHGVGRLAGNVKTALTGLEDGQKGANASGVQSAVAQAEVYETWKTYLNALSGRCGQIQGRLEKAGNGQYKNDEAIKTDFDGMEAMYKDTPAVGGDQKAR
ncbi:hypothetical protein [Streptomyces mashuensis]|nr:hypothetical protein [Streptomyces mashuensis]